MIALQIYKILENNGITIKENDTFKIIIEIDDWSEYFSNANQTFRI